MAAPATTTTTEAPVVSTATTTAKMPNKFPNKDEADYAAAAEYLFPTLLRQIGSLLHGATIIIVELSEACLTNLVSYCNIGNPGSLLQTRVTIISFARLTKLPSHNKFISK